MRVTVNLAVGDAVSAVTVSVMHSVADEMVVVSQVRGGLALVPRRALVLVPPVGLHVEVAEEDEHGHHVADQQVLAPRGEVSPADD